MWSLPADPAIGWNVPSAHLLSRLFRNVSHLREALLHPLPKQHTCPSLLAFVLLTAHFGGYYLFLSFKN